MLKSMKLATGCFIELSLYAVHNMMVWQKPYTTEGAENKRVKSASRCISIPLQVQKLRCVLNDEVVGESEGKATQPLQPRQILALETQVIKYLNPRRGRSHQKDETSMGIL